MKIGLVYTGVTPELIELVNAEVKKQLGDVEIMNYKDPSIINEVVEHNNVTVAPAARLVAMYMQAMQDGADAILNNCSSVGEVADACQDLAKYIGVPIVRIDEEMCREAVKTGKRIGIMATLSSTLIPTKNTVLRLAREMNREIELVDVLVEGGFGLDQEQFKQLMTKYAGEIIDKVDVILFAQGSMAYCEEYIHEKYNKPVLSSPRFGAIALKEALIKKGLMK
ncbi:aspartate/glutamate racemase family protein [Megamonas hypermegale]|uniref:aspartate/glutamate racemase family protein n=1 Tax=Megamonas hypermegale TaxID=158847 RepID=UPI0025A45533|nr:aspartate/glutamate racemase family protein [Megamonas hypermegale]MDM8142508.1 aspartate/glutamate racemase family protein [Megamonas hypermegale]